MNTADAIRSCFRTETVRRLRDAAVAIPASSIVATDEAPAAATPCWVKRGDVHAMEARDVVFAADRDALTRTLDDFRRRGIASAVLQAHVDGPVLKFYGVAGDRFFRCHADVADAPAPIERLAAVATTGAAALGLEVFGGDLVVAPDGTPVVIDVNDWPSFARCREDAAEAIAEHAAARLAASAPRVVAPDAIREGRCA
jgi:hypothetical protein